MCLSIPSLNFLLGYFQYNNIIILWIFYLNVFKYVFKLNNVVNMKRFGEVPVYDLDDILTQLGRRLGLALSFDENDQCCLILDYTLMLSIKKKATSWLFYGMLQADVSEQEGSFWQYVSSLNLSLAEQEAGAIAYEPTSGALLYVDSLNFTTVELNKIYDNSYAFLEKFVDSLESLKEQILNVPRRVEDISKFIES